LRNLLAPLTLANSERSRPQRCQARKHPRRSQWRWQTATRTRPGGESGESPARAQAPPPQLALHEEGISIVSRNTRNEATDGEDERDPT
jgi:hypothetical protein